MAEKDWPPAEPPLRTRRAGRRHIQKAIKAERQRRAFDLRKTGVTFPEIAATLGVSVGQAFKDYDAVMKSLPPDITDVEAQRKLDLERIDRLLRVWFPLAIGEPLVPGGPPQVPDYDAAMVCDRLLRRREALLGLAPQGGGTLLPGGQRPGEGPLVMVFGFDASKFPDTPAIETTALTPVRNGGNGHDAASSPSGGKGRPQ